MANEYIAGHMRGETNWLVIILDHPSEAAAGFESVCRGFLQLLSYVTATFRFLDAWDR